jgi:16S rRNA U1498 N3-methylase RsmE
VWPVFTARSVPRGSDPRAVAARAERLRAVAAAAAAQCGRADVPEVREAVALEEALGAVGRAASARGGEGVGGDGVLRIVPWEGATQSLRETLERFALPEPEPVDRRAERNPTELQPSASAVIDGLGLAHGLGLGAKGAPVIRCVVLVGPEGGLEADEVARAEARGFRAVSLGPRILRTETVAPALLALLSFARGDLRRG